MPDGGNIVQPINNPTFSFFIFIYYLEIRKYNFFKRNMFRN
jgi:hypothetical protein